ncbi:MAG: serine/threonine protein kinase [Verrucomicrobiales bacterium]|jgi:serine/threonine protein kinase
MTGRRLADRYELIQRVGTGGMAEVWEGIDHNLGRRIAIKVLHSHLAADSNVLGRFRSEAQAAARLTHPGIVGIYDTVTTDDTDAIIMELVSGRDLRTILDERPTLAAVDAVEVGVQLAAALGHAHHNGIIHRDVKPANILVRPDRRVKLSDFGIAKALDQTSHTESGSLVGTVKYLAPEQIEGHPVDGRTDLYGLTTVLYEMLCGQVPFAANDLMGAMERLRKPAPSARKLRPDIPPALDAFLQKGLARNPADRYPDAAAWSASLTETMRGDRPSPGPDATVIEPPGAPSIQVRPTPPPIFAAPSIPMAGPGPSASRPVTPRRGPKPIAEAPIPVAKHVKAKRKRLAWVGPLIVLTLTIAAVVTVWMLAGEAMSDLVGGDAPTSTEPSTDDLETSDVETGESTTAAPTSTATVEPSVTTEESTTTTTATTTTTTTTEAPFIAGVRSSGFDPLGDNNEHNDQASLALDGDPTTFWRTESYATSAFGQIKEGVGLIVEFEEPRSMKDLQILANRVGWSAELYEADVAGGSFEDWGDPIAEFSDLGTEQTLDVPDISVPALLLWVTDLGLAADQTPEEYEAQVEAGEIVQQLRIFELTPVS